MILNKNKKMEHFSYILDRMFISPDRFIEQVSTKCLLSVKSAIAFIMTMLPAFKRKKKIRLSMFQFSSLIDKMVIMHVYVGIETGCVIECLLKHIEDIVQHNIVISDTYQHSIVITTWWSMLRHYMMTEYPLRAIINHIPGQVIRLCEERHVRRAGSLCACCIIKGRQITYKRELVHRQFLPDLILCLRLSIVSRNWSIMNYMMRSVIMTSDGDLEMITEYNHAVHFDVMLHALRITCAANLIARSWKSYRVKKHKRALAYICHVQCKSQAIAEVIYIHGFEKVCSKL